MMQFKLTYKKLVLIFICLNMWNSLIAQDSSLLPGANFDLSAWKLQTLNESNYSFTEVKDPEELANHSSSFFYTDKSDGSMVFRVPSNGGTTSSGVKYPRVELRQMDEGGNWNISDVNEHYLTAQCKVIEIAREKPKTIIGQIHGSESNSELLKLRWSGYKAGECFIEARLQTNDNSGTEYGVTLASELSLGDMIDYTVTMKEGVVTATVNGNSVTQTYTKQFYGTTDHYYFKAGNYIQWNDDIVSAPPIIYGVNKFYKLLLHEESIPTGIDLQVKKNHYRIYPNPAKEFVMLDFDTTMDVIVKIFDTNGRLRIQKVLLNNQIYGEQASRINLNDFNSGLYFIRFVSDQKSETKKLLISK